MKKIEKRPPALTGNPTEDNRRMAEYLEYLREQMNYILSLIERRLNEGGNGNGD